jgi:hypothetical protein
VKRGAVICSIPRLIYKVLDVLWGILWKEFDHDVAPAGFQKRLEIVVLIGTLWPTAVR